MKLFRDISTGNAQRAKCDHIRNMISGLEARARQTTDFDEVDALETVIDLFRSDLRKLEGGV